MDSWKIPIGTRLYCTASLNLAPGSDLTPGKFARRLFQQVVYTGTGPVPGVTDHMLMDMVWEVIRLREFPQHPSRWECLYLWQMESQARHFHSHRPWPTDLYEVEVVECRRALVANMDLVSYMDPNETIDSLMERARRYWKGLEREESLRRAGEVLLEGTARVIRCLTERPE